LSNALAHYPKSPLSFGPFTLSKVGLRVSGKPTLAQWQTLFDMLQGVDDVYRFVMGDALKLVEIQYGEKPAQLTAYYPEYDYERLKQYRTVAMSVELGTRVPNLSWSHHSDGGAFIRHALLPILGQSFLLTIIASLSDPPTRKHPAVNRT